MKYGAGGTRNGRRGGIGSRQGVQYGAGGREMGSGKG